MYDDNACPLESYQELEPLCSKGHVMLVQNAQDGQLYVKKRLRSCGPELYRQLREKPAAGTPVIYGIHPDGMDLVIIEEYLPGHTLEEQLRDGGPLNEEDCFRVGLHLCGILMELHSRNPAVIHRDIKPSNVMLLPDGRIALLDFSAAKLETPHERRDTMLIGTAGFAAPEQYGFSTSTAQTDIYGMGVLLNALRTGAMPWERQAGGRLGRVLDRCLRMEPRDRYANVRELRAALKQAQRERFPWLPPGFRSMCWYKAVPATLAYVLIIGLSKAILPNLPYDSLAEGVNTALCVTLSWLLPVVFYSNYLGVRRLFPLMRSRYRWVRMVGLVIAPIWLWLIICLAVAVVGVFFA